MSRLLDLSKKKKNGNGFFQITKRLLDLVIKNQWQSLSMILGKAVRVRLRTKLFRFIYYIRQKYLVGGKYYSKVCLYVSGGGLAVSVISFYCGVSSSKQR